MTAKEQLRQLTLNQRIDQRLKLIEYYMEQAERMGGALSQVGVVSGTKTQSPMADWVDKAIDLAADISKEVDALRARAAACLRDCGEDTRRPVQASVGIALLCSTYSNLGGYCGANGDRCTACSSSAR